MSTTSLDATIPDLAGDGHQFKDCPCECGHQADTNVNRFFKANEILLGPGTPELTGFFSKVSRVVQVGDHRVTNGSFEGYNGPAPQISLKAGRFGSGDAVCDVGYEFTFEAGHLPSSDALAEIGKRLSDGIKRDLSKLSDGLEYLPTAMGWAVTGTDISFCHEYGGDFDIIEEFNHAVGAESQRQGVVLSIPITLG